MHVAAQNDPEVWPDGKECIWPPPAKGRGRRTDSLRAQVVRAVAPKPSPWVNSSSQVFRPSPGKIMPESRDPPIRVYIVTLPSVWVPVREFRRCFSSVLSQWEMMAAP